jgi:hypothetical protein
MTTLSYHSLGRSVGEGAFKKAYILRTDRTKVVVVACNYGLKPANQLLSLKYELARLARLAKLGFPVVEVDGIVKVHSRSNKLYYGLMMPRHLLSTNDCTTLTDNILLKTLNKRTIKDAKTMIQLAKNKKVDVYDFQCLIKKNGSLAVHDPLRIVRRKPRCIVVEMELIIKMAEFCIAHRNKKVRFYKNAALCDQAEAWAEDKV